MRVKLIKKLWLTFCQLVCDAWTEQGILVWNIDAKQIFVVDELVCPDASVKFWAQGCWDVVTCGNWVIAGKIYSDGEES